MATTLLFARLLPAPKVMGDALDSLVIEPALIFPVPASGGGEGGSMTEVAMLGAVNAWKTAITAGKIVLFKNAITPDKNTAYEDLVVPTGSWYTLTTSALGEAYHDDDGNLRVQAVSKQFNYSGTDPAETIIGWGYVDVTA